MATRAGDWFRQAEADLMHARHALRGGHHEWACFAAQQAAEKAAKAAHQALGHDAWGHSVTELLQALQPDVPAVDDVCWIARVRSTSCTFPHGVRTVCPRALRPITTRRPRQNEPSGMRRRSLSAVEEYYRGRQVRVFRLKHRRFFPLSKAARDTAWRSNLRSWRSGCSAR